MEFNKQIKLTLWEDLQGDKKTEIVTEQDKMIQLPRLYEDNKTFLGWNKYNKLNYGFMSKISHDDDTMYAIFSEGPAYVIESEFIGDAEAYSGIACTSRRYVVNIYLENTVASSGVLQLDNCNNILYYNGHVPVDGIAAQITADSDTHGHAYSDAAYFTTSKIKIEWTSEAPIDAKNSRRKIAQIMLAFSRFGIGYNEIARRTSDDIIIPSHRYAAKADDKPACVSANFYMGIKPMAKYPRAEDDENVVSVQNTSLLPEKDRGELLSRFAVLADSHIGRRYNWANYDWLYNTYENINRIHNDTPLDFVLQLGDNIDDGYDGTYKDDYEVYLQTIKRLTICNPDNPLSTDNGMIPNYELQGNHDTSMDTRFFRNKMWYSVNASGRKVAFISFFAVYGGYPAVSAGIAGDYASYASYGIIGDETVSFIEQSIKEAMQNGASQVVLCSHWGIAQDLAAPILPETGLGAMENICKKYNIRLLLNGHEHNVPYTLRKYNDLYDYDASMTKDKYAVFEIWEKCVVASIYDTNTQKICRVDMISF